MTAARLVTVHIPLASDADLARRPDRWSGRSSSSLGIVAVHDPGALAPDPDLAFSFPAYAHLSDTGRLPVRVHACLRDDALDTALAGGLRSGDVLGSDPDGPRHGSAGRSASPMARWGRGPRALLEDIEPEPDRPLPPDRRRGLWMTRPGRLEDLVQRAAAGGIATQIHAIGDAAVRVALDVLTPDGGRLPLMPRIEHVQLLHPGGPAAVRRRTDRGERPAGPPRDGRRDAPAGCGATVPRHVATPGRSLARTGAVLAFGTDAPVEPVDPWPGIAQAVTPRAIRAGRGRRRRSGPAEALTLDRALRAACVDAAISAGEIDRGRLIVGHRADVVVLPPAILDDPVEPRRRLATARPNLVLMDGRVVFER